MRLFAAFVTSLNWISSDFGLLLEQNIEDDILGSKKLWGTFHRLDRSITTVIVCCSTSLDSVLDLNSIKAYKTPTLLTWLGWPTSPAYILVSVPYLCVFFGVSAARHSWWTSCHRRSSYRQMASRRCASAGGPSGGTSCRTPSHSPPYGRCAASSLWGHCCSCNTHTWVRRELEVVCCEKPFFSFLVSDFQQKMHWLFWIHFNWSLNISVYVLGASSSLPIAG